MDENVSGSDKHAKKLFRLLRRTCRFRHVLRVRTASRSHVDYVTSARGQIQTHSESGSNTAQSSVIMMEDGSSSSKGTGFGGRKRRADLWTYFEYHPAERKTECVVTLDGDGGKCGHKLGGKNTTNLKRHLKTHHADIFSKVSYSTPCPVNISYRTTYNVTHNNRL